MKNTEQQNTSISSNGLLNSIGELNILNSLNSANERLTKLETEHSADLKVLQKDIEVISNGLESIEDSNKEKTIHLDNSLEEMEESVQEMRGEINQIKISIDSIKAELNSKKESKSNMINNLLYPIIVIILTSILGFLCTTTYKIYTLSNQTINNERVINK